MSLQREIDEIVAAVPHVRWSISISGAGHAAHEPGRRLRTASVGKLLLLIETARRIDAGELDPAEILHRDPRVAVADSGLWRHLATDALPVADVAVLVAAVSDNYATNVLLQRIGPASVARLAAELGLEHTALHDRVRDHRGPEHPVTLSTGTAGELAGLMRRLAAGEVDRSGLVDRWLAHSTDLSMVAAAFHDDPLDHPDGVRNKTGTAGGIRADVGYRGRLAYAVLANWDPAGGDATAEVMTAMRAIGDALRR